MPKNQLMSPEAARTAERRTMADTLEKVQQHEAATTQKDSDEIRASTGVINQENILFDDDVKFDPHLQVFIINSKRPPHNLNQLS